MTLPDLALVYYALKSVDAIACCVILGAALPLIVARRLESVEAVRTVLRAAPFAALVPWIAPFALFNVLVAALGVVTASRANMGTFEVLNHALFPLLAAILAALALNLAGGRTVSRSRNS
ncbi:MAG: hypothetical protein WAJ85_03845 [Candidatus Baltobacteraceae bacterium]|jgi:hypothetical protein